MSTLQKLLYIKVTHFYRYDWKQRSPFTFATPFFIPSPQNRSVNPLSNETEIGRNFPFRIFLIWNSYPRRTWTNYKFREHYLSTGWVRWKLKRYFDSLINKYFYTFRKDKTWRFISVNRKKNMGIKSTIFFRTKIINFMSEKTPRSLFILYESKLWEIFWHIEFNLFNTLRVVFCVRFYVYIIYSPFGIEMP